MQFTEEESTALQRAYDHLNAGLFGGELPPLLILLHRHPRAYGYFRPDAFCRRETGECLHEIALNPDTFKDRTDIEILSTLAHEQCHQWQQDFGKPPRRCYHNREWATKMEEVGLMPSSTGQEGGKKTGQRMSHYVIAGGRFERVAQELVAAGFKFGVNGKPVPSMPKKKDKVKYVCDTCGAKAWAKQGIALKCGICDMDMDSEE